jgi:hypothetical protein
LNFEGISIKMFFFIIKVNNTSYLEFIKNDFHFF